MRMMMPAPHVPGETLLATDPLKERRPDFEMVAAAFLAGYRNEHTRDGYRNSLRAWFAWCLAREIDPLHAERIHIILWQRHLEDVEHKALRTIAHHLNALSGYYRTAVMDSWLEKSPMQFIDRPPIERKTTSNTVSAAQMKRLIDYASTRHVRDEAIFCLMGWNGLRVGEVVGIDIGHIELVRGIATLHVMCAKYSKPRDVPLAPRTYYAVTCVADGRTEGPLFLSLRTPGKRMCRGDVQRLVKRYAEWCHVEQNISPHSFRHAFVTNARNAGCSDREIQRSCGHADSRMVDYYDHGSGNLLNDPDVRRVRLCRRHAVMVSPIIRKGTHTGRRDRHLLAAQRATLRISTRHPRTEQRR